MESSRWIRDKNRRGLRYPWAEVAAKTGLFVAHRTSPRTEEEEKKKNGSGHTQQQRKDWARHEEWDLKQHKPAGYFVCDANDNFTQDAPEDDTLKTRLPKSHRSVARWRTA